MYQPFYKKLMLIIIVMMVASLACGLPATSTPKPETNKPTEAPTVVEAKTEPTKEAVKAEPTATKAAEVDPGVVANLDDVKNATIQIQAEGTFIDPQVGLVVNGAGRGSGFIIDPSGIAVTNNHVVTGSALLKVWVGGNKEKTYSAKVLGASECSDLAVIKIEGADFPFLQWHDGAPKVSTEVYAAGFPLGDPEFTLTKGIVSKANADGKTSWASITSVLEHDARINPGNSGGPLVDKDGKVVGVNYASNQSNQYFAISRAEADSVVKQLKEGTDVTSIGVNGQIVGTEDGSLTGVWVSSVKSGSPADKSGVKPGDIIMQLEGLVLGQDGTMADYCQILRSHKPTDTLSMTILRWQTKEVLEGQLNGRELKVTRTLEGAGQQGSNQGGQGGTTTVSDDSSVITLEIPEDWQYNGDAWENTWSVGSSSFDFTAQTLTVSPDVKGYNDGWDTMGLFIATSEDWGNIGGYANLLEGVSSFYKDCRPNGRKNYKDANYEGMVQVYSRCGPNRTNALVLAARPIKDPQAYLVMVEYKYTTEEELNLLDAILTTSTINP